MPIRARFDELPEAIRRMSPEARAAVLQAEGIELDQGPSAPALAKERVRFNDLPESIRKMEPTRRAQVLQSEGIELENPRNPFTPEEKAMFDKFGDDYPLLTKKQTKEIGNMATRMATETGSSLMGGTPLPAALAMGTMNAALGPDPTSGQGMANMASNVIFGRLMNKVNALQGLAGNPFRSAAANTAASTGNVMATQYAGDKLAAAKGEEPTSGGLDFGQALGLGALTSAIPGTAGWFKEALTKAKGKVDALAFKKIAEMDPADLKAAQQRLQQAMQVQSSVEGMTPEQRMMAGMYDSGAPSVGNPFVAPVSPKMAQPAPAKPAPVATGRTTSDGLPLKEAGTPYDAMLTDLVNDPDPTAKALELSLQLRKNGATPQQIGEIQKRFRELTEAKATAARATATTETGLDFRRVDEGRPSRANAPTAGPVTSDNLPLKPRVDAAPVPLTTATSPVAAPANHTIGELAEDAPATFGDFSQFDDAVRALDPKRLASLAPESKSALASMQALGKARGGKGGLGRAIHAALTDPGEFNNLPRYVNAMEEAFPEMGARSTVQASILSEVLSGAQKAGGDKMSMLQRIRGMGPDRAKAINNVFGSQDAYKNIETLHDIAEEAQQGSNPNFRMYWNMGRSLVAPVTLGSVTFYLNSSVAGVATPAIAAVAVAGGTGKLITMGLDQIAGYVASNRTKALDVLKDLASGGGRYSPQTVNQVLGGLRRRAMEERDITEEEAQALGLR